MGFMDAIKGFMGPPKPKRPVRAQTIEEIEAEAKKALADAEQLTKEAKARQELYDANIRLEDAKEALRLAKMGQYK